MLSTGALRDDVHVEFANDFVRVGYALWEVALPAAWVAEHPGMTSFLRGRKAADAVETDPEATAVLQLLDAQGCLQSGILPAEISLADLRKRFDRLRNNWYAQYYAHPLWNGIRNGSASRNELVAYLIHNYHISRAAGSVAARMATRGISVWREFFSNDARMEYWHCDAYYFVQSEILGCTRQDVKQYVALPASTAFEQHALQMAEHNSIAHLLIAYFQESSVMFKADTDLFYAEVERSYGLRDFFRPWKNHIAIDVLEGHAASLAGLFRHETIIDGELARESLAMAFAAYHFLLAALDEIMAEHRSDNRVVLRGPVRPDAQSGVALLTGPLQPECNLPDSVHAEVPALVSMLADSALKALAAARTHDEIMLSGWLRESFLKCECARQQPKSPWTLAVAHFIAEAAVRPFEWAALLALSVRKLEQVGADLRVDWRETVRRLNEVSVRLIPDLATELFRLDELIERWFQRAIIRFPEQL